MNTEQNQEKKRESSISFSEQKLEKENISEETLLKENFESEKPKKKLFYGVRSLFSPMPGYGFSDSMKVFWKTAFVDSFAMSKKRNPIDSSIPFDSVLNNWGLSSDDIDKTIRVMDLWVILFGIIEIIAVCSFVWGTQTAKPFFFCLQMFMIVLIPPIPLAVTLWKRDILKTRTSQSFLHWFKHGFLGLTGIILCLFWFAMPIGQTLAQENSSTQNPSQKEDSSSTQKSETLFLSIPDSKVQNQTDLSSQLLFKLFGEGWKEHTMGIDDEGSSVDVSAIFLALFGGINTLALVFVSVFLVYIYAAGAVNGSQSGKWTDDQVFSSFWSPVRSSFAVAFCAPLPSGLSLMQVMVMTAIAMSINFANDLKTRVDSLIENSMATETLTDSLKIGRGAFSEMFNYALQSAAITYMANLDEKNGEIIKKNSEALNARKETEVEDIQFTYNPKDWSGGSFPFFRIYNEEPGKSLGGINDTNLKIASKMTTTIQAMYDSLLIKMKNKNSSFFTADGIKAAYLEFYTPYTDQIKKLKEEVVTDLSSEKMKKNIFNQIKGSANYGWTTIGTYTFSLAHIQGRITEELNKLGTQVQFTPITFSGIESLAKSFKIIENDVSKMTILFEALKEDEQIRAKDVNSISKTDGLSGVFSYISAIFMESSIGPVHFAEKLKKSNPVTALVSYGQNVLMAVTGGLTAAGALFGAMEGAGGVLKWLPGFGSIVGGGIKGVLTLWGPLITFACGGLISFAVICVYVLPAVPLIYWMRALFTWLILCIETLIGAPFWAASHALPEGKGFAGQHARRGYLMLLDVMIRPTLLVVGATVSLLVICSVGYFMGTLFHIWAKITQDAFSFTFVGVFVMTIVLMYITYETCVYVFVTAVGHMPEQVIRWAGGQSGSTGTSEAISQISSMKGQTSSTGSNVMSGLGASSKIGAKNQ